MRARAARNNDVKRFQTNRLPARMMHRDSALQHLPGEEGRDLNPILTSETFVLPQSQGVVTIRKRSIPV
jgi:hypothetical protein